jgi:hypothetical protein|tara:strand:+ start:2574 stop:2729 length:156 start_codon:yes stop_codon:yes gene_type:complete
MLTNQKLPNNEGKEQMNKYSHIVQLISYTLLISAAFLLGVLFCNKIGGFCG